MANELGNRSFAGKVALVTGAASGIGRAVAERLAQAGAKVALADMDEPKVTRVVESIRSVGGDAIALRLDVTSEADWTAGMDRLVREWGRLDISVNSAGIAFASPIPETSLADWKRVLPTNLDGVFLGTRHAMTAMKNAGGGWGHGRSPRCSRVLIRRRSRRLHRWRSIPLRTWGKPGTR